MQTADLNLMCAWALVDVLVDGGVRDACLSPGSRSTSLALALSRHPGVTMHVHLDERSSAFFAIGLARAAGRPVAIACTSGTAAAGFLPGVIEASQSRTPLIVLTADRPPRLRGTGANQTIEQPGLYGGYVRAGFDLPVPETPGQEAWWRQAAREALDAARGDPVGPVHVNCPFEEPLSPSLDLQLPPPAGETLDLPQRPEAELTLEEADRLAGLVSGARGVVVAGGWPGDVSSEAGFWADAMGWPLLAEPTSSLRRPDGALAAGQSLICDPEWSLTHRPEIVIQFGAAPTSRATQAFVASAERLVVADRWHLDPDPERRASWRLAVDPDALGRAIAERPVDRGGAIGLTGDRSPHEIEEMGARRLFCAPGDWTRSWREADGNARAVIDAFFDSLEEPFEPRILRDVASWVPAGGTLFVGNSSPMRDLDLTMIPRDGLRVMANRGASGIDGSIATALGIAAAGPRIGPDEWATASAPPPTVAVLGDLSFLYDVGTLMWATGREGIDLVLVVIRNGGGEIFSLLPQRHLPEHRALFITPHAVDLGAVCAAAGVGHVGVERAGELRGALETCRSARGLQVVEVLVDPVRGLELRAELRARVAEALSG